MFRTKKRPVKRSGLVCRGYHFVFYPLVNVTTFKIANFSLSQVKSELWPQSLPQIGRHVSTIFQCGARYEGLMEYRGGKEGYDISQAN